MNRVHSSEEAPRSFTMAPCVDVERFEGKKRCRRAAVSEHAGIQAREWSTWLFTKKREVNEKMTKPCNSPHKITKVRRPNNIPLICTGAGPIHPVHSQPMSLATEAMPETRLHFCHFPAVLNFVTLDKESNMSTLWWRKEFPRICSDKDLVMKAQEIEVIILCKKIRRHKKITIQCLFSQIVSRAIDWMESQWMRLCRSYDFLEFKRSTGTSAPRYEKSSSE